MNKYIYPFHSLISIMKMKNKKNIGKKFVKKNKPVGKPQPKKAEEGGGDKGKNKYNVLRGMHDILPKEERYWKACYHAAEKLSEYHQFGRIEMPILEEANLFIRSIGRGTDVVDKEMYLFEDRDGSKVCLRPEATASVVRAYNSHGMWNLPQPTKLWYWGAMFRHDRPQAGRYREFFQVGFETMGSIDPALDAELILLAYNFYQDIGLPVEIHVNSIGNLEDREKYKIELVNYYRSKRAYLCEDCKARISRNPMRLLDCKEAGCQPIKEEAPQIINWLGPEAKSHFMKVLEYLDELEIPYVLKPFLVRGLDYYNNTVFEVYPAPGGVDTAANDEKAQSALGGGGRYDSLVEIMGGRSTQAVGMALGIDRTITAWKQYNEVNKLIVSAPTYDVYFAQLGEEAKRVSLRLINDLRKSGVKLAYNFCRNSLKSQLETANSLKVPLVIILGQKEVQDKTVIIRDMESGVQEVADQKKIEPLIKKKLETLALK